MLYPYPTDIPATEIMTVVVEAMIKRQFPDPKYATHCVWHATGYGLSVWDAQPVSPFTKPRRFGATPSAVTDKDFEEGAKLISQKIEEQKAAKEAASSGRVGAGSGFADPTFWIDILPLLLKLLELIRNQSAPPAAANA